MWAPKSAHDSALDTHLAGDGAFQETLDLLDRDAVDDRAEEAFDDQLLRFGVGNAPRLKIEDVLRYDLRNRRAVRAAHVVGGDFQLISNS